MSSVISLTIINIVQSLVSGDANKSLIIGLAGRTLLPAHSSLNLTTAYTTLERVVRANAIGLWAETVDMGIEPSLGVVLEE